MENLLAAFDAKPSQLRLLWGTVRKTASIIKAKSLGYQESSGVRDRLAEQVINARLEVLRALGRAGASGAQAIGRLAALARGPAEPYPLAGSCVERICFVIDALLDLPHHPVLYWRTREVAVEALGGIGATTTGVLEGLLGDNAVSLYAVNALAKIGPAASGALLPLVGLLRDTNLNREAVTAAIEALVLDGSPPPSGLIPLLRDRNQHIRAVVGQTLRRCVPVHVEAFVSVLEDADKEVRDDASFQLATIGSAAVGPLIARLGDPSRHVRVGAASALAYMGASATEALRPLARLLRDNDDKVSFKAFYALLKIGPAPVADDILAALRQPDRTLQRRAAELLGECGTHATEAAEYLGGRLWDGSLDSYERAEAADRLRDIGPAACKAVPLLLPLLDHGDAHLRLAAARALVAIDPSVTAPGPCLIHDPVEGVRFFALRSSRVRTRSLTVWQ